MRSTWPASIALLVVLTGCAASAPPSVRAQTNRFEPPIALPSIEHTDPTSLSEALAGRRSAREYAPEPLGLAITGQLFWAAQGITDELGHRTAPSAGARYPLEIYAVTAEEILHYLPAGHRVEARSDDRTLDALGDVAFGQSFVADAPTVLVITGVIARTEEEYGAVAPDLVNRESGHAAQNVLLQATALDLVHVPVGGFDPAAVADLLALPPGEQPLYLIPVGHRP